MLLIFLLALFNFDIYAFEVTSNAPVGEEVHQIAKTRGQIKVNLSHLRRLDYPEPFVNKSFDEYSWELSDGAEARFMKSDDNSYNCYFHAFAPALDTSGLKYWIWDGIDLVTHKQTGPQSVQNILRNYYDEKEERHARSFAPETSQLKNDDVVVWYDKSGNPVHAARVVFLNEGIFTTNKMGAGDVRVLKFPQVVNHFEEAVSMKIYQRK